MVIWAAARGEEVREAPALCCGANMIAEAMFARCEANVWSRLLC